jgi:hypothetical protein
MTTQTLVPPKLGTYWEGQGGIYAGIMRGHGYQPDYHLIVAPAETEAEAITYGPRKHMEGVESHHNGHANTAGLTAAGEHPAAAHCAAVEVDGHTDFYLPSRDELRLAYVNAKDAFTPEWYWTSTQCHGDSDTAWVQGFAQGFMLDDGKSNVYRARAVRRIEIVAAKA